MFTRKIVVPRKQVMLAMGALASMQAVADQALASGSQNANLSIKATIQANCLIADATMDFSTFTILGGSPSSISYATQAASVSVPYACTDSATAALYGVSSVALTGSGGTITANLYSDAGHASPFPSTSANGVGVTGSGVSAGSSIYATIVASSTTAPGTYSGVATLTIAY